MPLSSFLPSQSALDANHHPPQAPLLEVGDRPDNGQIAETFTEIATARAAGGG